jgi:hypothetical protein
LAQRCVGVDQHLARDLEADRIGHLAERAALDFQVSVQGSAVH